MKSLIKKKISEWEKQQFVGTLADLLKNGFSLGEALAVMARSRRFRLEMVTRFQAELLEGKTLAECFVCVGMGPQEIAQIQLAERRGNLVGTLRNIEKQIGRLQKQKNELRKLLAYPVLLVVFVTIVLLGMRQFLLPQLLAGGLVTKEHWGIRFLYWAPYLIVGLLLIGSVCLVLFRTKIKKLTALETSDLIVRLPILRQFYPLYLSDYFALEWGKLFDEGVELKQIIGFMQATDQKSLMYQLAEELDEVLNSGGSLVEKLADYRFLTDEFSLIVFQGETKGKLGEELLLYSDLTYQLLFRKIEAALRWLQPVIFLVIALLIISVYAAMFLPIYGNLDSLN